MVTDRRLALAGLVIVANLAALGMLSARLLAPSTSGGPPLLGAMQVWITNVIGFGTLRVPDQLQRFQSNGHDALTSLLVIARAVGSLGGGSG